MNDVLVVDVFCYFVVVEIILLTVFLIISIIMIHY